MFHTNELPLTHLMTDQGMGTAGASNFTAKLCHLIRVRSISIRLMKFEVLELRNDLREIPEVKMA